MIGRKEWDPNRPFAVTIGSRWRRPDATNRTWVVTDLWRFEQGSGRELLAVTLQEGKSVRRMSQARLLSVFREVKGE